MTTDKTGGVLIQEDASWIGGASPAIQTLEGVIAEIAPTNIPVLLVGESGTGKEMFANRIHRLSQHSERPLTRIACASMNPTALSAELGSDNNRGTDGRASSHGTVFFDEIGELDAACQRNLLCALPDGTRDRAGDRSRRESFRRRAGIWMKRCARAGFAANCITGLTASA